MVYKPIPAIRATFVLHAQWSDLPEAVVEEVREMWRGMEMGNDFYYVPWNHEEDKEQYPGIAGYLEEHDCTDNVLIHFWW